MLPSSLSGRPKQRYGLPPPGGGYASNGGYAPLPLSASRAMTALRTRTRLTNLAVLILLSITGVSLLTNMSYMLSGWTPAPPSAVSLSRAAWDEWDELASSDMLHSGRPPSVETTITRDSRMADVDHLIMVPGHAVWTGHDPSVAAIHDDDWVLEHYQKGGSVQTYVGHIERGAKLLKEDPHALLVFSGGATRSHTSTPLSESVSYHRLAVARGLLSVSEVDEQLAPAARATTEEYALDSYENLLFSMARFREVTGRWPDRVTVVGYGMKRKRFEQLHRGAIRFPAHKFNYVGIDDEGDTTEHYSGELKHAYAHFLFSPSGCRPPLSQKRTDRNPYSRYPPYHASTPELGPLLEWCPPQTLVGEVAVPTSLRDNDPGAPDSGKTPPKGFVVYDGQVPWDEEVIMDRERD
ncbi:putative protein [Vanrija pseudolonga]|uniref:Purtative protein n=1 Tax=Vanrija pseudolonga TaxID=143232 RepID=A0AAF1BKC3_9TREE|nr:purtative protein [Vanrija pseudolonga]